VVHADIKPSNLFVHGGPPESMHVLDLGLAELKRGNPGSSQVLGSSRYMSPEFISKSLLTTALDVYQMGLVLAEMISGRPAVDAANTFACSLRHCKGELDIPEPLTVPPLAKVMDEALVIDHRLRFATAGAFAKALNGCLPAFGGRQTTEELTRVDDDLRVTAPTTSHDLPDTRPNSPPVGATAAAIPTALSQQAAPTRGREPLSLEERVEQRLATAGDDVTREIPVKVAKALDEDARLATAPDPDTPTRPTNRAAHTPD
jgi:serine/threonine protein kinase